MVSSILFLIFCIIAIATMFMILHTYHMKEVGVKNEKIQNKFKIISNYFQKSSALKNNMILNVNSMANETNIHINDHNNTKVHLLNAEKHNIAENIKTVDTQMNDFGTISSIGTNIRSELDKINMTNTTLHTTSNETAKLTSEYIDDSYLQNSYQGNSRENANMSNAITNLSSNVFQLDDDIDRQNENDKLYDNKILHMRDTIYSSLNPHVTDEDKHHTLSNISPGDENIPDYLTYIEEEELTKYNSYHADFDRNIANMYANV